MFWLACCVVRIVMYRCVSMGTGTLADAEYCYHRHSHLLGHRCCYITIVIIMNIVNLIIKLLLFTGMVKSTPIFVLTLFSVFIFVHLFIRLVHPCMFVVTRHLTEEREEREGRERACLSFSLFRKQNGVKVSEASLWPVIYHLSDKNQECSWNT